MADVKTEKKFASLETAKKINDDIASLKEDLGKKTNLLLQSIKHQTKSLLDIEFEPGSINAENGIYVENENSIRTKDFIDLLFYDEFIITNLRKYGYDVKIIYYNDDGSYNSYIATDNSIREYNVNKTTRNIKLTIEAINIEPYPISDWDKYYYFEGVINKESDNMIDDFISDVYSSLSVKKDVTLLNSVDKVFNSETAALQTQPNYKSYILDVKPYERYKVILKSYLFKGFYLVTLTDNNNKPYKIFTEGNNSFGSYEADVTIPPYITKMYVISSDNVLPIIHKLELCNHSSIWNSKKAVFLGDSITAGSWYNPTLKTWENMTENWTYWVSKLCGMTYKNYGIGGTHVSSAYNSGDGSKAEQAFTNRYSDMDDDADVVFVMGGTNDWLPDHTDTAPFGNISDNTDVSFCGAIRVLCEGLIKKYNGKQIFFLTPICNANQLSANPTTGKTLKEYCDAITEICGMYSIEVINTHVNAPLHFMIAENASKYCSQQDGSTHPNDLGQKLLGEYIARAIS